MSAIEAYIKEARRHLALVKEGDKLLPEKALGSVYVADAQLTLALAELPTQPSPNGSRLREILDNAAWNLSQAKWQEWAKLALAEIRELKSEMGGRLDDAHEVIVALETKLEQALKGTDNAKKS